MVLPLPPTHAWSLYLVQRSELSLTPHPLPKGFPDGKLRHHRTGDVEQVRLAASFRPQRGWVCKGCVTTGQEIKSHQGR